MGITFTKKIALNLFHKGFPILYIFFAMELKGTLCGVSTTVNVENED